MYYQLKNPCNLLIYKGFKLLSVVPSGFEPEHAEPKSAVLPLHHGTGKSAGKCIKKNCPKKYHSLIPWQRELSALMNKIVARGNILSLSGKFFNRRVHKADAMSAEIKYYLDLLCDLCGYWIKFFRKLFLLNSLQPIGPHNVYSIMSRNGSIPAVIPFLPVFPFNIGI